MVANSEKKPSRKRESAELMKRFAEGDEAAFREILTKYKDSLYSFLTRFLNRRDLVEDVFQETFLQVIGRQVPRKIAPGGQFQAVHIEILRINGEDGIAAPFAPEFETFPVVHASGSPLGVGHIVDQGVFHEPVSESVFVVAYARVPGNFHIDDVVLLKAQILVLDVPDLLQNDKCGDDQDDGDRKLEADEDLAKHAGPGASALLALQGGRRLERGQVQGGINP